MTIRIILALVCTAAMDAQPPAACALTGQVAEKGKVDPDEIQFVSNPRPFSLLEKSFDMSFDFAGRVVNLRPLFKFHRDRRKGSRAGKAVSIPMPK